MRQAPNTINQQLSVIESALKSNKKDLEKTERNFKYYPENGKLRRDLIEIKRAILKYEKHIQRLQELINSGQGHTFVTDHDLNLSDFFTEFSR
jgi:hypothetical protein